MLRHVVLLYHCIVSRYTMYNCILVYFSVATGTGQPEDSEENEKLDESSPDTGQHPPSDSSEAESSNESNAESEQEEASEYVWLSITPVQLQLILLSVLTKFTC